jgi:hypothetical protein
MGQRAVSQYNVEKLRHYLPAGRELRACGWPVLWYGSQLARSVDSLCACRVNSKPDMCYTGFDCWSTPSTVSLCGGQRAGGYEFLAAGIKSQVQAFQTSRTEEKRIPFFRENNLINSEVLVEADDREADAAGDLLPVNHHKENVLLFAIDPDFFQTLRRRPSVSAAGVHEQPGQND